MDVMWNFQVISNYEFPLVVNREMKKTLSTLIVVVFERRWSNNEKKKVSNCSSGLCVLAC